MSLEEYGIDRYKVTDLFKEGPRGPKGPPGTGYSGAGQIIIRERVELSRTSGFATTDILAHTIQPGELDRFNESILIMFGLGGAGGAFPITSPIQLRWQRPAAGVDVLLTTTTASPVAGVCLTEIQADPFSANNMYVTSLPSSVWNGSAQQSIAEDWITLGGRFVVRAQLSGTSTGAFTAIYMLKRSI